MSEREPMSYREKIEAKRDEMVNTMLEFIQNNSAEWERGWYKSASEIPVNGSTGKPYRGINMLYLMLVGAKKGYTDNRWVTFNQAHELGAHVKRGEKAREISYWSQYDKLTKKPFDEKTVEGMTTQEEKMKYFEENVRPVLKFYQVFNAEQCDNFPERKNEELTPEMAAEERARQNALIEQVIKNSAAPISYGGSKAYYSPSLDEIHLPKIEDFKSMQDYYATALHEIAHSTGHESRLNRDLKGIFGTEDYAKEELRAELASVFMQTELGITIDGHHFENHGAYLTSWLKAVREDTKEFFAAARDAEKISDYVAEHYLQAERSEESAQEKNQSNESEAMPVFARDFPFADQVDAMLNGEYPKRDALLVRTETPDILREVGLRNLPMLTTQRHLIDAMHPKSEENAHWHGLSLDLVKGLPDYLDNPVMIMDTISPNANSDGSVVIVTDRYDGENLPLVVSIKVEGNGRYNGLRIDSNFLTGYYGKNDFENFIKNNLKASSMLYWNKEKSQELYRDLRLQLPQGLYNLDSDTIIRKVRAFVKPSAEKISENSANAAQGLSENIKEWYSKTYPNDEAGQSIHPEATFKDLWEEVNRPNPISVYGMLGEDSVIRERAFLHLAELTDKSYKDIYSAFTGETAAQRLANARATRAENAPQKPNFEANVPNNGRVWLNLDIPTELLGAEGESKARMIKLPQGEYSHFVLFVPKAWLKPGEKEGAMKLSVDANFEYTIRNDGREVKLSGSELRAAFEGKEVGKRAQRTAPSRQSVEAMEKLTANVPAEMKALPNWCVFRTKWNEEKGKKDKTIISPVDGKWAKSNDPSKWTDFETAKQYALEHGAEGLAFALDAASGISCIDLDKCIDKDGKLTETSQKLTSEISETYTETSASGNGIHIFLKDDILVGGKIKNRVETKDGEIEVYDSGRFISMTGNVRTNVRTLGKTPQTTKAWLRRTLGERAPQQTFTPKASVEGSDQEIIARIRKSKKGPEFDALMAGENLANDHSRSDYRLLNMLAFFTDGNQEQMARIFRSSGLYRPEKGEPYLQRSVTAACNGLTTRYGQGQGGAFRSPSKGSSNAKGR